MIDRPIHRHVQFAGDDQVVLGRGIVVIQPERIRGRFQVHVAAPKPAIRTGQLKSPVKLLADHVDHNRILGSREID